MKLLKAILVSLLLVSPVFVGLGGVFIPAAVCLLIPGFIASRGAPRFSIIIIYQTLLGILIFVNYSFVLFARFDHQETYFNDFLLLCVLPLFTYLICKYVLFSGRAVHLDGLLLSIVVIWSCILLFELISIDVKNFLKILFYRDYSRGDHLVDLRSAGVHPTGGDGTSLNLALLLLVVITRIKNICPMKGYIYFFIIVVSLLGILSTGRSGFFVFVVVFLLYFLTLHYRKLFVFLGISVVLFLAVAFFATTIDVEDLAASYGWENPYVRFAKLFFVDGGGATLKTLLGDMLVYRSGFIDFVFGVGDMGRKIWVTESSFVYSDLGNVRIIGAVGLFGYMLLIFYYFFPFLVMFFLKIEVRNVETYFLIPLFVFISDFKIIYSLTRFPLLLMMLLFSYDLLRVQMNQVKFRGG